MATVTKDFKVKNGIKVQADANIDGSLYVGGNATINGSDIITEDAITGGTQTNIAVTYDPQSKTINFVAENGIADSTTTDLVEGTNLYFTEERAQDAAAAALANGTHTNITVNYNDETNSISLTGAVTYTDEDARAALSGGSGIAYNQATGEFSTDIANGLKIDVNDKLEIDTAVVVDVNSAQTLSNKTISEDLIFGTAGTIGSTENDIVVTTAGDILLNPAGGTYVESVSSGNRLITQSELDAAVSGLSWKQAVNLFATANVPLTGETSTIVIDGHAALGSTDTGYRLLLTAQTVATENGIYDYIDNGTTYTLTRSSDADTTEELVGAAVFVMEGTSYANTSWVQNNHYETSFADLVWIQFSGQGEYVAGIGITIDGNTIKIDETTTATRAYVDAVTTTDVEEGTNLYFTDSRAVSALEAITPNFEEIDINSIARQVAATAALPGMGTNMTVYSFSASEYRSAKFLVKLAYGTHTEVSEILLTLDTGNNVAITEYAIVGTNGSLGTISAEYEPVSGNVMLLVNTTNSTVVNIVGTLLA